MAISTTHDTGTILSGPTPKHAQLREILRELAECDLAPGAPLPSERGLAERYQVSRLTVRSAIGQLVDEGLLDRIRGRGTFTATERMDLRLYLMSFTAEMRARGRTPTTDVLYSAPAQPPAPVRTALGLPVNQPAHRLVRLRKADGQPLAVERGWYHADRLPWLRTLDLTRSLYGQLAHRGVRFDHAKQTVWSEAADRETAKLLGIRTGAPLLAFRRVSSMSGAPMEDMTSWYRGDQYQVTMQLDRTNPEFGPLPIQGGKR